MVVIPVKWRNKAANGKIFRRYLARILQFSSQVNLIYVTFIDAGLKKERRGWPEEKRELLFSKSTKGPNCWMSQNEK